MTATTSPARDAATSPPTIPAQAYAAFDPTSPLGPFSFSRRAPGPRDVQIDILFCGVCHSDLHTVKSEWQGTTYPVRARPRDRRPRRQRRQRGDEVQGGRRGRRRLHGRLVPHLSRAAATGWSSIARTAQTFTYNSPDPILGGVTYGGYSSGIVVDEDFVPARLEQARSRRRGAVAVRRHHHLFTAAALEVRARARRWASWASAGWATWASSWRMRSGAHVVLFTTSPGKSEDGEAAGRRRGRGHRVPEDVAKQAGSFDLILNTVSATARHRRSSSTCSSGTARSCLVGVPEHPHPSPSVGSLIFKRRSLAGSLIGGIKETQEMLDFCAEHNIVSDIEMIPMQKINEAYERMLKSDVKYRFVIDMASLK